MLTNCSSGITLGLRLQPLQCEDGNVVIRLSERQEDQLLLHESVLGEVSERFRVRFANDRFASPREIVNPKTGDKLKIFEYHLTCTDRTFSLTDEVRGVLP